MAWNFLLDGGPSTYDFWPSSRNGHTFAMPYFVGLQGDSVTMTPGTFAANELVGQMAEPVSLFEAQLGLRMANNNYSGLASITPNKIIDDSFADGDRTATGALDADWWSSSQGNGSNVDISAGALSLVTGTSGRGMHATFAPQVLAIGDSITATYAFTTPATIGVNRGTAFKVALMDLNNPGLAADLLSSSSSSNPLYVGQPGYFSAFDVDSVGGGTQDTDLRKHDIASTAGRFLGTATEWSALSSSADAGYAFAPNTDYVGVFKITRTGADSVDVFSSLRLAGGALLDSHTASDTSAIANNFGMLGFWVNSNSFGSSNVAGTADNGLTFTNVMIESTVASVTTSAVDIPLLPLGAFILLALSLAAMQMSARKPSLSL